MPFQPISTIEGYTEVNTYADLPDAGSYTGELFVVLTTTGIIGINRKRAGLWRSDGVNWSRLGVMPTGTNIRDLLIGLSDDERSFIMTDPSAGEKKIYSMRSNAAGNLEYSRSDQAET